jgi:Lrp/AsnC family transcriptional regulator, leucine-responsive regulatory protein
VGTDRIDEIDSKMLELLQENGRMKRNAIAEIVELSVPSVSERMRKLEERGVIEGYHAVVDAKRLHIDITAFIRVMVDGSSRYPAFVETVVEFPEVQEVHSITGEGSHIVKVRTRNTTTLERLLAHLQALPGVSGTSTSIVLSTYKETRSIRARPMELFHYETQVEEVELD